MWEQQGETQSLGFCSDEAIYQHVVSGKCQQSIAGKEADYVLRIIIKKFSNTKTSTNRIHAREYNGFTMRRRF
ncbi:hypothetical protein M413DRAFT_115797 [Hebeloma cylindrosporum]|uniref:Uncharacterized protein n=1 Tax=Hebeloma cylindrosporum TaxID=76867 RepID=A0A0C2YJ17_HEBCY|nr:hypothetical protein M413DRAFT_115797 [Hebeloma cylindrosporum h7]